MGFGNLHRDATVGGPILHSVREKTKHVFRRCFVVIGDCGATHDRFFAGVKLEQENSCQCLIRLIIKLYLKGDCNILWRSKHPELFILSIVNLARLELSLLLSYTFHGLSYRRRKEIPLELSELSGNFITHLISLLSNFFILGPNLFSFFFTHGFFDLWK